MSIVWLDNDDSVTGEGVSRVDVNFVNIPSFDPIGRDLRVIETWLSITLQWQPLYYAKIVVKCFWAEDGSDHEVSSIQKGLILTKAMLICCLPNIEPRSQGLILMLRLKAAMNVVEFVSYRKQQQHQHKPYIPDADILHLWVSLWLTMLLLLFITYINAMR